ncbi:glycosyltransferase family 4 protein [Neolewinella agarilytica]|uniref:Glycosyltransferase involved in cell wall bisynthesis n=1 Tax=Neolewinella agarilytica TaxID=478744 RepID=A0A1H9GN99_9BACT|nr:glycosyltransferase family 4 protein [Neolewinella agarilytica]SEQ51540.1 Glycosyltransferase involved in cell wall bisynthesis [Neolewinella agarilytica]
MSNLRIVFPTGSFYPAQTGGPDNTVYWITKALIRQGHHPVISTTDRGQPDTTPLNRWLDTEYGEVIYTRNPIHYLPISVMRRALSRLVTADVLHLSMITYPAAWLMAIINTVFYKKPMLWSSRGDLDPPMLLRSRKRKKLVLWLINSFVNKDLVYFHSTCDAETTYIRDAFGADSKVVQIPNYMELPDRVSVPKEHYLLYIGRIDPKKAIENLIEGLAASSAFRDSDFVLKIAGSYDNDYGHSLMAQSKAAGLNHKIEFLGHRAGVEKEKLLAGAWFKIMPSHTENFGIVAMEAMAQGTPVVASLGTPWQILEEKEAGYWVDNSPESLQETVEKILRLSPEKVAELSANALKLAREEFSIYENVNEWETAYQTAIQ